MNIRRYLPFALCGIAAGIVNGLFGAGGGMLLVPMLTWIAGLDDNEVFPTSVSIIAPICVVSLLTSGPTKSFPWHTACPYLLGSIIGGILAGQLAHKIPTKFLHRILGLLILWGGIRYLC